MKSVLRFTIILPITQVFACRFTTDLNVFPRSSSYYVVNGISPICPRWSRLYTRLCQSLSKLRFEHE